MSYLIIANILSFITACFTVAASWTKDPRQTYWYQAAQCLVYAVACYFFGVYASILMMLINASRNALIGAGKYTKGWCALFCTAAVVLGLWINDGSAAGYLTIFITFYYTLFSYLLKTPIAVKVNVAIDLALWIIYDLMVIDISSTIVDVVGVVVAIVTIFRILKSREAQSE